MIRMRAGFRRGDQIGRPYDWHRIPFAFANDQYSMNVVWHYHECVQFHKTEMVGDCQPTFCDDFPNSFKRTMPSAISPNKHARWCVTIVTKYAPGRV
jgi:hypothetical protein